MNVDGNDRDWTARRLLKRLRWRVRREVGPAVHRGYCRFCRILTVLLGAAVTLVVLLAIPPVFKEGVYFLIGAHFAEMIFANEVPPGDSEGQPVAGARPYATDDFQALGGRGEGLNCSLPWGVERAFFDQTRTFSNKATDRSTKYAPVSLQMRQACIQHDYCYRHGAATYSYTQADCDYLLQAHAFRLCRFFSTEDDIPRCRTKARMITLGVRIGGRGSFKPLVLSEVEADKPDARYSTYFEFDPYPFRSARHAISRIADAPAEWVAKNSFPKALYVFVVRPSGLEITIVGWPRGTLNDQSSQALFVKRMTTAAYFHALPSAPLIARARGPLGRDEDWFVFWQRRQLTATGGRFVVVAPSRATQADWDALSRRDEEEADTSRCAAQAGPDFQGASGVLRFRKTSSCASFLTDDFDVSDFHIPPHRPGGSGDLTILGLTTSACLERTVDGHKVPSRATCIRQADIAVSKMGANHYMPPFRALLPPIDKEGADAKAPPPFFKEGSSRYLADRYRSFIATPFVASASNDPLPLVMWLRRGDAAGNGYADEAELRRHAAHSDPSEPARYLQPVVLKGFQEEHEPAMLINRYGKEPKHLLTLSAGRRNWPQAIGAFVYEWTGWSYLAENTLSGAPRKVRFWTIAPTPPLQPFRDEDKGQPDEPISPTEHCKATVAAEWMARAAIVDGRTQSPTVYFSQSTEDEIPRIKLRALRDVTASTCAPKDSAAAIDLAAFFNEMELTKKHQPALKIAKHQRGQDIEERRRTLEIAERQRALDIAQMKRTDRRAQLRRSPLLVADMNGDGGASFILVNTEAPDRSLLFGWGEQPGK